MYGSQNNGDGNALVGWNTHCVETTPLYLGTDVVMVPRTKTGSPATYTILSRTSSRPGVSCARTRAYTCKWPRVYVYTRFATSFSLCGTSGTRVANLSTFRWRAPRRVVQIRNTKEKDFTPLPVCKIFAVAMYRVETEIVISRSKLWKLNLNLNDSLLLQFEFSVMASFVTGTNLHEVILISISFFSPRSSVLTLLSALSKEFLWNGLLTLTYDLFNGIASGSSITNQS